VQGVEVQGVSRDVMSVSPLVFKTNLVTKPN